LVAEQFYFRDAVKEAADYLYIPRAIVEDQIIHCLLDLQVTQENFCPPDAVKLLIVRKGLPVIATSSVYACVQEGKEEGEVVEAAKEDDVLFLRGLLGGDECGVVEIAHGGQFGQIGPAAFLYFSHSFLLPTEIRLGDLL
jgi:hypothetical protein